MIGNQPPIKTGLLEFLRNSVGSQFVIPVYQRNYTWTANKEVKQYFDDLEMVLKGKYNKHFMGILIYLDTQLNAFSREFSVIDGQQRLTTTFLTLYAIKYILISQSNQSEAASLEGLYLTNQYVEDKLKLKLKPLVADDEVYQQIVDGDFDNITQKNSNIYKNFVWIKNKLLELFKIYGYDKILQSLDRLYVVCVPVSKEDSPQKIFESINSTGAKLFTSDLIRNYLLMDIQSDIQEKYYKTYWKKIEEYLTCDSKRLELFFRMFIACKNKTLSNTNAVYSDFKDWFSKELEKSNTEDILKDIVKYAKYYYIIYKKPVEELNPIIKNSIEEFRKILSDMPAPFLMEIYSLTEIVNENGESIINFYQLKEIIDIVNTYLIRRAICGLDTSDITRLFPTLLKDVVRECEQKNDYLNIIEYTKKNLINKQRGKSAYMPDDEQLKTYLKTANAYNLRLTLKIIFDKIELFNNPAPVDLRKLSIEHLMPQTPTQEWLDVLKVDEITYEKNLHRLGNLTLATKPDNSKMSNKPFEYKKEILADTAHLTMNMYILSIPTWTIKEIDKRTDLLIEQIIALYPYVSASNDFIAKHNISLDWDNVYAIATFYEEDGSVEVLSGSTIVKYPESNLGEWQYDVYNSLLEEGIITETENGAIFVKDYLFTAQKMNSTALSISAGVILCGNRNGWEYWKDENGKPLNENKELKKRVTGK